MRYVSVPLRGLGQWKVNQQKPECRRFSVSVPLRGLGQWKGHAIEVKAGLVNVRFQSPCGDQVSGKNYIPNFSWAVSGFQSPCGDQVSGKCSLLRVSSLHWLVSVPLRGLGQWKALRGWLDSNQHLRFSPLAGIRLVESQFRHIQTLSLDNGIVSVPLRGLGQWKGFSKASNDYFKRFQSPCGDQVSGKSAI